MRDEKLILTYKKHRFSPLKPEKDDIDIEDISHSLSLICRANGHFRRFYSVGEHAVNCAKEAEERGLPLKLCLVALLHDSSEAYLSDVVRPIKLSLPDYRKIERELQEFIYKRFNVKHTKEEFIKINSIDDAMLYAEFVYFTGERLYETEPKLVRKPDFSEKNFKTAEKEFLDLYRRFSNRM